MVAFRGADFTPALISRHRKASVSRRLSPEKAARRAERAAKDAAQRRQEERRGVMLLVGVVLTSLGLLVADYFWLRHEARQRHQHHYHRDGSTNATVPDVP